MRRRTSCPCPVSLLSPPGLRLDRMRRFRSCHYRPHRRCKRGTRERGLTMRCCKPARLSRPLLPPPPCHHHAAVAPAAPVAELEVVRRFLASPVNDTFISLPSRPDSHWQHQAKLGGVHLLRSRAWLHLHGFRLLPRFYSRAALPVVHCRRFRCRAFRRDVLRRPFSLEGRSYSRDYRGGHASHTRLHLMAGSRYI